MDISNEKIDIFTELINLGIGQAAGILNQLINEHITLEVPSVKVAAAKELSKILFLEESETQSFVRLTFKGSINGFASLVFPCDAASNLISLATAEEIDSVELDSLRSGTLMEIGNILLSAVMSTLSNTLSTHLSYSVPTYYESSLNSFIQQIGDFEEENIIVVAETRFSIAKQAIKGEILLIFEVVGFQNLLVAIDSLYDKSSA
ncbi:MAG: chemotaxis protein CheC [Candidatus Hodarchaeota archaeon]